MIVAAAPAPKAGQLVRVRSRHWLVEDSSPSGAGTWLRLACLDDDAQGDNLEVTARYLRTQLEAAIAGTDREVERIAVYHGPSSQEQREILKRAFNEPPSRHPLRILIATDAAREGLNLQAHCWHLFHFDLPWNPSRLEQRNGRIDRKLQPSPEVFCHYFVYSQRPEDRVLRALVRKTETIRLELGSLSEVIEKRLRNGIRRDEIEAAATAIEELEENPEKRNARLTELDEAGAERQKRLRNEIETLRNRIDDARRWIGLDEGQLRDALNCSLDLLPADRLQPVSTPAGEPSRYVFPNLQVRRGSDSRWSATLDTLRQPAEPGQPLYEWRRESPLRPIVFSPPSGLDSDTVQMHLSHRVVQRLLGRFLSQGSTSLRRAKSEKTRMQVAWPDTAQENPLFVALSGMSWMTQLLAPKNSAGVSL